MSEQNASANGPSDAAENGGESRAPAPAPAGHATGLPAEAFTRSKPIGRYPGRSNPRRGDLVLTIILTLVLYAVAYSNVHDALDRNASAGAFIDGIPLATVLAVAAPIVLSVFSTVFSILFLLRRVYAFWLPIFAGILIVALYSVTQQMIDNAVINGIH